MGQSSSRQRRQEENRIQNENSLPTLNPDEQPQSHTPNIDTPSHPTPPLPSTQPATSSSSRRRSIFNLIIPSSRNTSHADISRPRNWRRSRRFSKTPVHLEQGPLPSTSLDSLPTALPRSEMNDHQGEDEPMAQENSNVDNPDGPASLTGLQSIDEIPGRATGYHHEPQIPSGTSPNTPDPIAAPTLEGSHTYSLASNFSDTSPETVSERHSPPIVEHAGPAAQNNSQFTPSGTLVVVQGVVHTTDAPRTSASTPAATPTYPTSSLHRPRPSSAHSLDPGENQPRNRISSLLRGHPPSTTTSRPVSIIEPSPGSRSNAETHPVEANPSSDGINVATNDDQAANPSSPADTESMGSGPTNISSSSVEVLGTLLSVAAAATAASLLTGNSEAIFSPQNGPPTYSSAQPTANQTSPVPSSVNNINSDPWTVRPTSPTPTSGLADSVTNGRSERLRQAWGNIRERLGLRPTADNESDANAGPSTSPSNPNDPRELVLAQMARAFNLGFGEPAASPSSDPVDGESASTNSSQLPPEGSFERFLVDLQTELRVTLTSQETNTSGLPENAVLSAAEQRHQDSELISPSDFTDIIPDSALNSDTGSSLLDPLITGNGVSLESTSTAEPHLEPADASEVTQGASEVVDAQGRINWWRLYRFPPIVAPPRGLGAAGTQPIPARAPTGDPSGQLLFQRTEASVPNPDTPSPIRPQPSQEGTSPQPSVVVPVIVVGLQSVNNTDWPQEQDHQGDAGVNETDPSDENTRQHTSSEPTPTTGRNRGWPSRAAEAFRTLRTGGRRGRTNAAASTVGSRTFLIYVIGGYYPPDHNIVTGGSNNLDSFEALLELADLLGQAKPATASKDEIEKSGLEVVAASQLDQYVSENKVSSNCVERCLICLDDYAPEEDVRVMSCRHAFHRNCVDKWLETGRNNCPACRSKGVSILS